MIFLLNCKKVVGEKHLILPFLCLTLHYQSIGYNRYLKVNHKLSMQVLFIKVSQVHKIL